MPGGQTVLFPARVSGVLWRVDLNLKHEAGLRRNALIVLPRIKAREQIECCASFETRIIKVGGLDG